MELIITASLEEALYTAHKSNNLLREYVYVSLYSYIIFYSEITINPVFIGQFLQSSWLPISSAGT